MSARATRLNQESKQIHALPAPVATAEPSAYGAFGLGDADHPIAETIIKQAQAYKSFIEQAHEAWVSKNNSIVQDMALPPAPKERSQRSSEDTERLRLFLGLLFNILRMMRDNAKKRNKEGIQSDTQHPLLFVKVNEKIQGWCLARAFYRPLKVWGLRVCLEFRKPKPQILILAGFFGGRLRPDEGTQVPENSLKQFRKPKPQISSPVAGFFGGRLRPDKGTQVPENSLYIGKNRGATEQLFESKKKNNGFIFNCPSKVAQLLLSIFAIYKTRESVPQILIAFPVAGYFLLRPDSGTQVF